MSYSTYQSQCESGIPWIGKIPDHWQPLPAKRGFERKKQLNTGMICENRLALTMSGVIPRSMDDLEGLQASEFETYQIFEKDDLVFKLIDLQNVKTSRVGLVPALGIMSPAYIRLAPDTEKVIPRYAYWFFTDLYNREIFNQMGGGVRQTLGQEELLSMPIVFPPVIEQEKISQFIDHETDKIDALVAEQQRLIELLQEKRQAVISHAVTKGLDPTVPMKDSRVNWMGEVPAHWQVSSLGYFSEIDSGSTPDRENPRFWNGDIPWVKTGEVNYESIFSTEEYITDLGLEGSAARVAPPGTLLMAMYGQGVTRGRVAILEIPASYNQACAGIRFHSEVHVRFGFYFFIAAYSFVRDSGNETSQMNLSTGAIRKFKIAIPPLKEQKAIVDELDRSISQVDLLLGECRDAISILNERRTALISAAVTGKIDVRNWKQQ